MAPRLLKVHLQTFLSISITQKMPNFELWHSCRKWAICFTDLTSRDTICYLYTLQSYRFISFGHV
jgi:hypothetical protein